MTTDDHTAAPEHTLTERCGFDRNASHSEDCYVCTCGWKDAASKQEIALLRSWIAEFDAAAQESGQTEHVKDSANPAPATPEQATPRTAYYRAQFKRNKEPLTELTAWLLDEFAQEEKRLHFANSALLAERAIAADLRRRLDEWTKWGTIEVAIRNPNVASYMKHWEERAERAEAEARRNSEDTARLNYLDAMNKRKNDQYKTTYGWRLEENHNRVSLREANKISLSDHHLPALTVRAAIDAHRGKMK